MAIQDEMATAVLIEAAALAGLQISAEDAAAQARKQMSVDLFDEGLVVGDQVLDSLTFTELLAVIEEKLEVSLLDVQDLESIRTLESFVAMLQRMSTPEKLSGYVAEQLAAAATVG